MFNINIYVTYTSINRKPFPPILHLEPPNIKIPWNVNSNKLFLQLIFRIKKKNYDEGWNKL